MDSYLLNVGTNNVGGYFSSEQIDLLRIIQCNNLDDLIRFIAACDQIKHLFSEQEITSLSELDIENAKRKVFETYQNTMVLHNANSVMDIENKLKNIGVRDEHIPYIKQYLGNRDIQGIRRTIESLYPDKANDILKLSHHFVSQERDQIKSNNMYDEFVILNNNLPLFNTMLVGSGKIYSVVNSFYESSEPEYRFDFYKAKRDLDFAFANGKQVRFHSLLVKEDAHLFDGKSKEEIIAIMSDYVKQSIDFVNEYNNTHNLNGQPVINAIDLFNEIVSFDVNEQGQYYSIWESKYGITMQELMSIFDYAKEHKLDGVSYLYNEPFLENDDRRKKVLETLKTITELSPGLIDTLGSQMHITITEDLNKIKRCFDEFKSLQEMTGIKIQITEFDMSLGSREISHVFGTNADYTLAQVYDIKRNQMKQISQIIRDSGVNLSGISYWSLTDGIDCNLERIRTNLLEKGVITDINQIPTACGGLIPTHQSLLFDFEKQNDINIKMQEIFPQITRTYTELLESLPKETLHNLDIIYANKKWKTIKSQIPKGLSEEQISEARRKNMEFGKKEIERRIKQYFGLDIVVDSPEYISFISTITQKEKNNSNSALNVIEKYKNDLLRNYLQISSTLQIALPTQGISEINAVEHRENQYLNEIVNGIYATSGSGIFDYIVRTNTGGMIGNRYGIDFPKNPFDLNKSTSNKLMLNKKASVYQVDAREFEPVIDFMIGEQDKPVLRFGQEWISRKKSLACKEQIATYLPSEYVKSKQITIQGKKLENIIAEHQNILQKQNEKSNVIQNQTAKPISVKRGPEVKSASFTKRSEAEVQIATLIKEKNTTIQKQNEQQRNLNKPKVKTIIKPANPSGGYTNVITLSLIVSFVAGILCTIIYLILNR